MKKEKKKKERRLKERKKEDRAIIKGEKKRSRHSPYPSRDSGGNKF